jgi:hypothetical protein
MCDWVRNPFVGFSQNSPSMQEEEQLTELQCDHTLKMKFSKVPLCVLDFGKESVSCDLSRSSEIPNSVFNFLSLSTSFFMSDILKSEAEIVCFQWKSCEYVCQKFSHEFNIYAKRNKLKYHVKSKLFNDFACQL